MSAPTYSLVLPVYDEQETLPELRDRLCALLDQLDGEGEVIFVELARRWRDGYEGLVDRRALEAFRSMRKSNRYVRGMFSWIGFRQIGVCYECPPRFARRNKYTVLLLVGAAALHSRNLVLRPWSALDGPPAAHA